MKKHMTRNIILMLVLDVVLGIVLALYIASTGTVPAADNARYLHRRHLHRLRTGLSEARWASPMTITGGKVTNVQIDASGETPELGGKAAESACRPPCWLLARTAGVDAVSGSTMTSDAVLSGNERLPCTGRTVNERFESELLHGVSVRQLFVVREVLYVTGCSACRRAARPAFVPRVRRTSPASRCPEAVPAPEGEGALTHHRAGGLLLFRKAPQSARAGKALPLSQRAEDGKLCLTRAFGRDVNGEAAVQPRLRRPRRPGAGRRATPHLRELPGRSQPCRIVCGSSAAAHSTTAASCAA